VMLRSASGTGAAGRMLCHSYSVTACSGRLVIWLTQEAPSAMLVKPVPPLNKRNGVPVHDVAMVATRASSGR